MGTHIIDGKFQSDKYPTCPPGKVPLSVEDPMAQDLLWHYSQRRRVVDPEFSADLETALRDAGFDPSRDEVASAPDPATAAIEDFLAAKNNAIAAIEFIEPAMIVGMAKIDYAVDVGRAAGVSATKVREGLPRFEYRLEQPRRKQSVKEV